MVAAMVAAQPKEIPMTKAKSKRKPAAHETGAPICGSAGPRSMLHNVIVSLRRRSDAFATASVLVRAPNFRKTNSTWNFTV